MFDFFKRELKEDPKQDAVLLELERALKETRRQLEYVQRELEKLQSASGDSKSNISK